MASREDAPLVHPEDREAWREWLAANHATATGAWLVTWRRAAGRPAMAYEAAVEEALCFGWIDGQAATIDEERGKQYFSPRRAGSGWARTNKARVERLIADGRMQPAGLAVIERAKSDGTWELFDTVDRLEVPDDLAAALDARPPARRHWEEFKPGAKRALLGWIVLAKRPETRASRIRQTADAAHRNERANEPPNERPRGRARD